MTPADELAEMVMTIIKGAAVGITLAFILIVLLGIGIYRARQSEKESQEIVPRESFEEWVESNSETVIDEGRNDGREATE